MTQDSWLKLHTNMNMRDICALCVLPLSWFSHCTDVSGYQDSSHWHILSSLVKYSRYLYHTNSLCVTLIQYECVHVVCAKHLTTVLFKGSRWQPFFDQMTFCFLEGKAFDIHAITRSWSNIFASLLIVRLVIGYSGHWYRALWHVMGWVIFPWRRNER